MIYFPIPKCQKIIQALRDEDYDANFCKKLERMLLNRDSTTKKDIKKYMKDSTSWKIIFSLTREVLKEPNFPRNNSSRSLRKFTEDFLG